MHNWTKHPDKNTRHLIVAVDNLNEVIQLIRGSKTPKEAREKLMARFALTEVQAQAILDMRLQRLTNLEVLALRREYEEIEKRIRYYRESGTCTLFR